jgi:hypothetical protein
MRNSYLPAGSRTCALQILTRRKMRKFQYEDKPERAEFGCSQLSALSSCLATEDVSVLNKRTHIDAIQQHCNLGDELQFCYLNSCQRAAVAQFPNTTHKYEIFALLGFNAPQDGTSVQTFRYNLSVPYSRNREDGTERMYRNVGTSHGAQNPKRAHSSSAARRKPQTTRNRKYV